MFVWQMNLLQSSGRKYQQTRWYVYERIRYKICNIKMLAKVLNTSCLSFFVFVCLFGFLSHSRIFHSYKDVTMTGEGLQILTYARCLWSLSSEGSLVCHTYYDTGHPLIKVISEDPWHSHLLPSVGREADTTCFCDLGLSRLGFEHPTFRLLGDRSNPLRHRCCPCLLYTLTKWIGPLNLTTKTKLWHNKNPSIQRCHTRKLNAKILQSFTSSGDSFNCAFELSVRH